MAHSNQLREFVLTGHGIRLLPVYIGPGGVLTGSSRITQESAERADAIQKQQEIERKQQDAARKRLTIQAQVMALQAELDAVEKEEKTLNREDKEREKQDKADRDTLAKSRGSS
jgi:circadian clock protein KaiC